MPIKAIFPFILLLPVSVSLAQSPAYSPLQPMYPRAIQQAPANPMAYPQMTPPMQGWQSEQANPRFPQQIPTNPQRMSQQAQRMGQQKPAAPINEYSGYLGIVSDIIPSSVAAHLPKGTSQGQGILVKKFAPNSPAETSELKPFDVILSYSGTALNHPSQFIKETIYLAKLFS